MWMQFYIQPMHTDSKESSSTIRLHEAYDQVSKSVQCGSQINCANLSIKHGLHIYDKGYPLLLYQLPLQVRVLISGGRGGRPPLLGKNGVCQNHAFLGNFAYFGQKRPPSKNP